MIGTNAVISTYRFVEASSKETYNTPNLTGVDCYIERAQPDLAQFWDGSGVYEVYTLITCDVVDIKESDRVVDQDGNTYTVKGIQQFQNNTDIENHTEIVMMKTHVKA